MTARITPEMVRASSLNDLTQALTSMERSAEELSSGKKILEPSDSPYGASHIIELEGQLEGLSSYESNAQDGISWTTTAGGAMANINEVVQRVRELLVAAANGTNNQSDLATVGQEVEQLTESVKQDANTQFGGQFVFAGTATTTAPYQQGANDEYHGNAETISRAIGPNSSITISTNISTLLGNGQASGDGKLLDTLRTIVEHLKGGTEADKAAIGTTDLQNLDGNIETLRELQASTGSTTDQLQTALTRNEGIQQSITQALSNTQDSNFAATSVAFSNEQAAYTAALHATATIVQESLLNFLR